MEPFQTSLPLSDDRACGLLAVAAAIVAEESCRNCSLLSGDPAPLSCPRFEPAADGPAPCCAAEDGGAR